MALTITEKQHWKSRIEARIEKRIQQLKDSNLAFFTKITETARQQAISKAKIGKDMTRLDEIAKTQSDLEAEHEALQKTIYSKLYGPKEASSGYYLKSEINSRLANLQTAEEERLLADHELGRELAKLAAEKENLLDTVWLATSPRQVTDLWQKMLKLLGDETTAFQQELLSAKQEAVD